MAAVLAAGLVGCGKPPLTYTDLVPDVPAGAAASAQDLSATRGLVAMRLGAVGGAEVTETDTGIRVGLPQDADANVWLPAVCRKGEVQLVLMPEPVVLSSAEPPTWADKRSGQPVPARDAMASGEVLFTSADLAREARVERSRGAGEQWVVRFVVADARRADFRRFTAEHVTRVLAVVMDGQVLIAPEITGAVRGAGVLYEGPSRAQADALAAVLRSGPMPIALRLAPGQ